MDGGGHQQTDTEEDQMRSSGRKHGVEDKQPGGLTKTGSQMNGKQRLTEETH